MPEKDLTPKQAIALSALLAGTNQEDAAAKAGVKARQVRRWLAEDAFKTALRDGQAALLAEAGRRLLAETAKSIEVLAEVRDDPVAGPGPRVRAAAKILDAAFASFEVLELEERVSELEERLQNE